MKYLFFLALLTLFLCACGGDSKKKRIFNPAEYVYADSSKLSPYELMDKLSRGLGKEGGETKVEKMVHNICDCSCKLDWELLLITLDSMNAMRWIKYEDFPPAARAASATLFRCEKVWDRGEYWTGISVVNRQGDLNEANYNMLDSIAIVKGCGVPYRALMLYPRQKEELKKLQRIRLMQGG